MKIIKNKLERNRENKNGKFVINIDVQGAWNAVLLVFAFWLLFPVFGFSQENISIIPRPVNLERKAGTFILDESTGYRNSTDSGINLAVNLLSLECARRSGIELLNSVKPSKFISFSIAPNAVPEREGYALSITSAGITLKAADEAGLIHGVQTILQLLPAFRTNEAVQLPCVEIYDFPRFPYRGMHLDVSRHFYPPELIKDYIDLISYYKMNTFHWHLIDDQGWRIEIKKYPKLTDVGAWRVDRSNLPWDSRQPQQPGEKATYGGYYTQNQIREIVEYATARGVTIIPEIEMPAHVESAIAAYPELSCIKKPQTVLTGGIYPPDFQTSYCAGDEHVFAFLQDVLMEVMQLFPSHYIHIGGDELDKSFWKECPACNKRMKDEGLHNVDELQSYFIRRIEQFIQSKGRRIIGWDEILEGGLAPDATVMSWRGESGGIAAAEMGHDAIMTPGTPLYLNHYQAGPAGEPLANGGFNTLKMVYDYNPVPSALKPEAARHILGAQGNLWGEFIQTRSHVEYMVLPRMAALAEVVWSPATQKDFADFSKRLDSHFRYYEGRGFNYCKGNYTVDIRPISDKGRLSVELTTEVPGCSIHYTTDGTMPGPESPEYTMPIPVSGSCILHAVTVQGGKVMNLIPATQTFEFHSAIGGSVKYEFPYSNSYKAEGPNILTDGIRGTGNIHKYWHGFLGKDLIATITLPKPLEVRNLSLSCMQHYRDWIFLPTKVDYEVSQDGIHFVGVGSVTNNIPVNETQQTIKEFSLKLKPIMARYVRVKAHILPGAPKGHPGEGNPVWIFADEFKVN